jgi:hypothetical protein
MILFKRNFKFTNKKTSIKGIISSIYFLIAVVLIFLAIKISYNEAGNAGLRAGLFGGAAYIISLTGFFIGIKSFKEEDVFLRFPWIGTVGNAIVWIFITAIILIGL